MSDYNHDIRFRQFPQAMEGVFFGVVANRRLTNSAIIHSLLSLTSFKAKALSVKLLSAQSIHSR